MRENAVLPTLLCSTCFGCTAFVLGLLVSGRFPAQDQITPLLLCLGFSKSIVVATSWIFTFCALRALPISIATPIRASAPALVFLLAAIIYGEIPSLLQAIGMIVVFAGYFIFSWAGRYEGIDFFRNRAVWCAIAGAFFSALSAIWDKYIFQVCAAPVETIQFFFQVGLVFFYALILMSQRLLKLSRRPFEWRWTIPAVGILLAASDWLYFHGIAVPDTPISVASLARRFSVVLTFLLGARFFRETNLLRKGLALAAILCGIVILIFAR